MEVEIKELERSRVRVKIKLSGEEFSPYFTSAVRELSKKINIPGFRPGRVPQKIVEEKIGEGPILEEAGKIVLNEIFPKIVKARSLEVIGRPEAKIEKLSREEFVAAIDVAIFPKIKLPPWRQIVKKVKRREIKVLKEENEDSLKYLQKSRAKFIRKSSPCERGDMIEIDYEIRSGGVKIEDGDIRGQKFILGEGKLIPGFEEKLIGARENEERTFSLIAPLNFWKKEFQGKPLSFKVKIKGIFTVQLPKVNDEWARSLGNFKDLKHLKRSISEGIKMEKEIKERKRWQNVVLEKISREAEIELPDVLIEKERDQMIENLKKEVEEMGLTFENYLSHLKKTFEDLKKDFLSQAERRVRIFLCLYQIAKEEEIKVEDEEIVAEINKIIKKYPHLASEIKNQDQEKLRGYLKENILQRKVIELLFSEGWR